MYSGKKEKKKTNKYKCNNKKELFSQSEKKNFPKT